VFSQNEYIRDRRKRESYYDIYEASSAKLSEETEYICIDCGKKIIHYYDMDEFLGRIYRFRNRFRCKRCFFFLNLDMRRVGMDVENRHRSFLNNEEKRRIDYFGEGS